MDLTNEDVADVLALLDSLPYDELDLQTARFRLVLRRTPDGWTQAVQTRSPPNMLDAGAPGAPGAPGPGAPGSPGPDAPGAPATAPMAHRGGYNRSNGPSGRLRVQAGAGLDGAADACGPDGACGSTPGRARRGSDPCRAAMRPRPHGMWHPGPGKQSPRFIRSAARGQRLELVE